MGGGRLLSTSLVLEVNLKIAAEKWRALRKLPSSIVSRFWRWCETQFQTLRSIWRAVNGVRDRLLVLCLLLDFPCPEEGLHYYRPCPPVLASAAELTRSSVSSCMSMLVYLAFAR